MFNLDYNIFLFLLFNMKVIPDKLRVFIILFAFIIQYLLVSRI